MNKIRKVILSIFISLLLIIDIFALFIKPISPVQLPKKMPQNFNFIAVIGFESYTINTYENTLTKQYQWDVDTTIKVEIEESFKKEIYDYLRKIDIFRYPANYAPISYISVSPSFEYYLKFTADSIEFVIDWTENTCSDSKDAKQLSKLFEKFAKYIEKLDKEMKLPESERCFF